MKTENQFRYWQSTIFRKLGRCGCLLLLVLGAFFSTGALNETAFAATNALEVSPEKLKRLSLEELMNLDVTSVSKSPQPLGQAAAAIEVITGEQIRRSGASSLPESLRLADNLMVAQSSSASWSISSRGFNASVGNKLLVLIDGRSVYTPLFSGVIWNMQDYLLEDIDRIEVISGPGGTLWGANAVNGVINIISKPASETQGVYLEAGGGTWLEDFAGLRYGGKLSSNVSYRVYGKYFDRGAEVYADGRSARDEWNRGQGGFRIDADFATQNSLTLQGDVYGGNTHVVPGGEGAPRANGNAFGANVLSRWKHVFSDEADMQLQLYYDRTELGAPFQSSGAIPAGRLHDALDTVDLDFQDRFAVGERNQVIWGLGYRFTHDATEDAPLVAFVPGTLDQDLFSFFAQNKISLRENLFLTLGSKVEHNDYTGFEYEPSGSLQWKINDQHVVWGSVSRAIRAPSRYDRDLFQPSPAYGRLLGTSNSNFQSEALVAYEVGYRAKLHEKVGGSVSAFFNDYDNLRSANLTGTNLPIVFRNNLYGYTYGVELGADYQMLEWWRLHAGYTYIGERIRIQPGRTDIGQAMNETADPKHQVFVRSSMDLPGNLELDLAFRWIDTVHNGNFGTPGTIPSYAELDARLAWHATTNLEFSIVGQNLVHDQHPEAGFRGPAQEEIQRSVYGKVTWRF